jgi:predicted nucleic acid-binding protein
VLTELLDGLAQRGAHLRQAAARAVRKILDDRRVTVHPQSRESFLAELRLYEQRYDKGYSLVDYISYDDDASPADFGSPHQRPPLDTRRF